MIHPSQSQILRHVRQIVPVSEGLSTLGQDVYNLPKTVISREYSVEWKDGMEPYYPVNDRKNSDLYAKYKALADKEENVIFGGRLAEYRYYDMAPVIAAAMKYFPQF